MDERPHPRTCGFDRPLHPLQVLSYVVFGLDVCIYIVFVLALLHSAAAIVLVALGFVATVVALVTATAKATACNPADPHIANPAKAAPMIVDIPDDNGSLAFCTLCSAHVFARSKHCRECSKCVNAFDHHCMWLNNCVGAANYNAFFATILSVAAMIGIVLSTCLYLLVDYHVDEELFEQRLRDAALFRRLPKEFFLGILVTMLAVNVPLFLLDVQLILLHCFLLSQNLTTYEYISIKLERAAPEDGGGKYQSGKAARDAGGSPRKVLTLPRCMDWIVFCRCGRRRRRKQRNAVERVDTSQADPALHIEDASVESSETVTYATAQAEAATCPAPPGSTDVDADYVVDGLACEAEAKGLRPR